MQTPEQHIEALKHVGDIASLGAIAAYWLGILAGIAGPIATIVGAVWIILRVYDAWLAIRIKRKQLK